MPNYRKLITGNENVLAKIGMIFKQSMRELLIFSSTKLLYNIINRNNFVNSLKMLLKRKVMIKILTDDIDERLIQQFKIISIVNQDKPIHYGYSNKLGDFNEMVIISDNKYVLQINYDQCNNLVASFSNEEYGVLIQEMLFEKYWNEIKSLEIVNRN